MTRAAPAVACALASCIAQPDPPAPCSVYRPDGVNSDYVDVEPWLSADFDELFFASDRAAPGAQLLVYRATRASPADTFSAPEIVKNLADPNAQDTDVHAPFVTADGLRMFFLRGTNLFQTTRATRTSDFDPPGAMPNVIGGNGASAESLDGTRASLYTAPPGNASQLSIWPVQPDNMTYANGVNVPLSMLGDNHPSVDATDTVLFFDRATAAGPRGIFRATDGPGFTHLLQDPYPPLVANPAADDVSPMQVPGGHSLVFSSNRGGMTADDYDIFIAEGCN